MDFLTKSFLSRLLIQGLSGSRPESLKWSFSVFQEDAKNADGKLLCWLCSLSYKRALVRTKQSDPARHSRVFRDKEKEKEKEKQKEKR